MSADLFPRGIEILIKKAAVDPTFKELLLQDRATAAAEIELELGSGELSMLQAVSNDQLAGIIEQTHVPEQQRSALMGKVAATMIVALGVVVAGCSNDAKPAGIRPEGGTKGIRPDRVKKSEEKAPDSKSEPERKPPSAGIRPPVD